MEPAEIIVSVNQDNAELQAKCQQMEQQLSEMFALNNAMRVGYQNQAFEIHKLHQNIYFLQSYIASVEQRSEQGMLLCQQTAEFFERANAAESWSSQRWSQEAAHLSTGTKTIQEAVLTKIEESRASEEQIRELLEKVTKIESNILRKEIQNNELQHILKEKKNRLEEVRTTNAALVTARDDLIRTLNTTNVRLRSKVGKNAQVLSSVKKEKTRLKKELATAEASLHKNGEMEAQLGEAIKNGEKLQNECQTALADAETLRQKTDFYQREDSAQLQIISSLQREVVILQDAERKSGYTKTINHLKMEIAQLISNQAQLKDELQKNKDIAKKALDRMVEQVKIANEVKKEAAVAKGHALGTTHTLLVSLSQTKTSLAIRVAATVYAMLKDLDSRRKADEAMAKIQGYLSRQSNEIYMFAESVASNGKLVQDLIEDLQQKIPTQATPRGAKEFIAYVGGLVSTLERTSIGA
jgi:hypothetical protein